MNLLLVVGLIFSLVTVNGLEVFLPFSTVNGIGEEKTQKAIPFVSSTYQTIPSKKPSAKPFNAEASAAIIYDPASGIRLFEKQPDDKRAVASLNKLMTALVIMDSHKPDEIVTVGDIPQLQPADQKIGISEGEKFKLIDLLRALLIHSANDAANALAIHDSGSIEAFATKMNIKAQEWDLKNSTYANPSGLDDPKQTSTANNLLVITNILMQNQTFKDIVRTSSAKITSIEGKNYNLITTNKLLTQNGVAGVKTGFTLNAGQCLITYAERQGKKIVTVVLDSPDRFQESKNMIDWAFNNYIWQ